MAASITGVFEDNLKSSVNCVKVLVVGAGGIGCEVLKNLVLSGFSDIEIIDLDTIDVSNLNRQFLFHKQHVGKSKAAVARESALMFNPNVTIKAYHDSIISSDYGVNFFKRFALVMNALDNQEARAHVNRLCLAAEIPLIESGTAGYDGQVELINKGLTKCYECEQKLKPKTYPGCTIRNTPSEPIHCIVWGKHLFNQLFGEFDADQEVSPDTDDPEASGDAGQRALQSEANTKGNVERVSTRLWAQSCNYNAEKLFQKLFHDDILYLHSMKHLWEKRRLPTPLVWGKLPDAVAGSSRNEKDTGLKDQKNWSIAECAQIFSDTLKNLKNEFEALKEGDHLVWDKDNKDALDFVAACANIRAHVFGIPQKNRFEVKSMAGNIIPAIATTNAIIAGIVVLHAFNVLQGKLEDCQTVYQRPKPNPRNRLIVREKYLIPPNPKCIVCSADPQVTICVDVDSMTINEFVEQVLKKAMHMVAPDVILLHEGSIIVSSEEGETIENNSKSLKALSIIDGSKLDVDDYLQNYRLIIKIIHRVAPRDGPNFEIIADPSELKPKEEQEEKKSATNGSSNEDCLVLIEDEDDVSASEPKKRKTEETQGNLTKKLRTEATDEDDSIMVN